LSFAVIVRGISFSCAEVAAPCSHHLVAAGVYHLMAVAIKWYSRGH